MFGAWFSSSVSFLCFPEFHSVGLRSLILKCVAGHDTQTILQKSEARALCLPTMDTNRKLLRNPHSPAWSDFLLVLFCFMRLVLAILLAFS